MKPQLLVLLLLLLILRGPQTSAQGISPSLYTYGLVSGTCLPIREPYIESPCIAGIRKFVARSANTEALSDWIMPIACDGYMPAPTPPATTSVNCIKPYDKCSSIYCPEKYCQIIKSLIQTKASLLVRAANMYGKEAFMNPNTHYYNAIRQIVIDINAAYDCAGLQRPVIQGGGALEHLGTNVGFVKIPVAVIDAFQNEPGFSSFYLNVNGTSRTDLYFNKSRINYTPGTIDSGFYESPDITKIEARMWFFHISKMFIDLGYKSLHMGQLFVWGKRDKDLYNYQYTKSILNRIRDYAASKSTFVLLTEENFKALKFPGTNTFMFDFDSRAIRPREISSPATCGDFTTSVTPLINYLTGTPCMSAAYPAVLDPQVILNLPNGGNQFGYTPLHNCYTPSQPFNTYFDFAKGLKDTNHVASSYCNNVDDTWGWDDARWFGRELTESCRAAWMSRTIPVVRQLQNGSGFMIAPAVLPIKMPEQRNDYLVGLNPTGDGVYLMSDELSVQNNVLSAWTPNSYINVQGAKSCFSLTGWCSPFLLIPKRQSKFIIKATNPDLTTIYSWHVQDPNGNWLPFNYGTERIIAPSFSGNYTFYLRQDNLGTYSGTPYYGVKTVSFTLYLYQKCCGNTPMSLSVSNSPPYPEDFEGDITVYMTENTDFTAYDSYIERNEAYYQPEDSMELVSKVITTAKVTEKIVQKSSQIEVFPNPAGDILFVKGQYYPAQMVNIKIMDASGRMIKSITNSSLSDKPFEISLTGIAQGIYFINIDNESKSIDERLKFIKK